MRIRPDTHHTGTVWYIRMTPDAEEHAVIRRKNRWSCDCKDFYFRKFPRGRCKHIRALIGYLEK